MAYNIQLFTKIYSRRRGVSGGVVVMKTAAPPVVLGVAGERMCGAWGPEPPPACVMLLVTSSTMQRRWIRARGATSGGRVWNSEPKCGMDRLSERRVHGVASVERVVHGLGRVGPHVGTRCADVVACRYAGY